LAATNSEHTKLGGRIRTKLGEKCVINSLIIVIQGDRKVPAHLTSVLSSPDAERHFDHPVLSAYFKKKGKM
jgi:hypothetical protein